MLEDGRCYCQVADGITTLGWVMVIGRCYYQVVDGIATGQFIISCFFSSQVLNRASSQMCGRWYLPMFLFRDGLLTLIYSIF